MPEWNWRGSVFVSTIVEDVMPFSYLEVDKHFSHSSFAKTGDRYPPRTHRRSIRSRVTFVFAVQTLPVYHEYLTQTTNLTMC